MLESQRGFLLLAFAAVSFMLYLGWEQDQSAKLQAARLPASTVSSRVSHDAEPLAPALSASSTDASIGSDVPTAIAASEPAVVAPAADRYVELRSDTLRLVIDRVGANVVEAELLHYPQSQTADSAPTRLLHHRDNRTFIAVSGINTSEGVPQTDGSLTTFTVKGLEQTATGGQRLVLQWVSNFGLTLEKAYTLAPGSHAVQLDYQLLNQSSGTVSGRLYTELKRDRVAEQNGNKMGLSAYTGAAYNSAEQRYEKYDFDEMDEKPLSLSTNGGWVAYLQHYFVAAWVPAEKTGNFLYSRVRTDQQSIIGVQQAPFSVPAGASKTVSATLYLGPKIQDDLAKVADGLDLTVDYGFLWWIGQPLFWILVNIHAVVGNWGVAIILVTLAVKLALFPLANAQYRSFARMRVLQPKLQALKERYGDDRQAFSQAMMELYKKEKVNPIGGCLPLLLTMPVFIALYWVLMESVELRHAGFILWIKDLSVMDPYFVLPVLMGLSMWVTQKLQPANPNMDPMQQKIMQYLPVIMSVFFLWFPAGLVLYWLVNNLFSIAQQLYITKKIEVEAARKT